MGSVIKPVVWTTRSKKDLDKLMRFNTGLYGLEKAREIAFNIRQRVQILESPDVDFTKIGAIDTDFSHLKLEYRKLIERHYKITGKEKQKFTSRGFSIPGNIPIRISKPNYNFKKAQLEALL